MTPRNSGKTEAGKMSSYPTDCDCPECQRLGSHLVDCITGWLILLVVAEVAVLATYAVWYWGN